VNDFSDLFEETRRKPTPHGNKLESLVKNDKVPESDALAVRMAVDRYRSWVQTISTLDSPESLTALLSSYKRSIDIDLIYDSQHEFLYRYKGQHKVDNSVFEEFLPYLLDPVASKYGFSTGPFATISRLSFDNTGKVAIQTKDQDCAIALPITLDVRSRLSHVNASCHIAHVIVECKTNLDKTMFNECMQNAMASKQINANATYLLVCEWLDMEPIATVGLPIDEVIVLRKAKRLNATFRQQLSVPERRRILRDEFLEFYDSHPIRADCVARIYQRVNDALSEGSKDTTAVLLQGYF